jgi:hypothetical protein
LLLVFESAVWCWILITVIDNCQYVELELAFVLVFVVTTLDLSPTLLLPFAKLIVCLDYGS